MEQADRRHMRRQVGGRRRRASSISRARAAIVGRMAVAASRIGIPRDDISPSRGATLSVRSGAAVQRRRRSRNELGVWLVQGPETRAKLLALRKPARWRRA